MHNAQCLNCGARTADIKQIQNCGGHGFADMRTREGQALKEENLTPHLSHPGCICGTRRSSSDYADITFEFHSKSYPI